MVMLMRADQFCPPGKAEVFSSNPGSPIHQLYAPHVCDDGSIELVPAGAENTDEIIQSYAESTDIRALIARVNSGDLEALNVHKGMFGDFTQMPKTYAELLQNQMDAKRAFDRLPVDVKKKFDNDVNKFLSSAGTQEWSDALGLKSEMRSMNNKETASEDTVKPPEETK